MSEHVWMCVAKRDPRLVRGFWADLDDGQPQVFTRQEKDEIYQKLDTGGSLPRDRFPEKVFWCRKTKFNKSLPPFFHSGFNFLNEKAATILSEFDLGNGAIYPVELFENDRVTPIEGKISTLCIGNTKDTVLLGQSKRMTRTWPGHDFFEPHLEPIDDEIVVGKECLGGPDIWIDPNIRRVFFMSDRLVRRLAGARIKKAFLPVRCLVGK